MIKKIFMALLALVLVSCSSGLYTAPQQNVKPPGNFYSAQSVQPGQSIQPGSSNPSGNPTGQPTPPSQPIEVPQIADALCSWTDECDPGEVSQLLLSLDPAFASGQAPYPNGCSQESLLWIDHLNSAYQGSLSNFGQCTVDNGWKGSGQKSDPYRLVLDGLRNFVSVGGPSLPRGAEERTVSIWVYIEPTQSKERQSGLVMWGGRSDGLASLLGLVTLKDENGSEIGQAIATPLYLVVSTGTVVQLGMWTHLGFTLGGGELVSVYVNGRPYNRRTLSVKWNTDATDQLLIGSMSREGASPFKGAVGPVRVWKKALSGAEMMKECLYGENRFASVPGSICVQ